MSTYSASSRTGSVSGAPHPRSVRRTPSIGHAPPPPPSHSTHHAPGSGVDASRHQHRPSAATTPRSAAARAQQQMPRQTRTPAPQRESVMERNRRVRTPSAVEAEGEDAVTVIVGIVGVKFKCLVERDWPCESLVASAIAEYHLAYPTCEVPDSSLIFHVGRKQFLEPKDPVGKWCQEGDEIELGVKDRPVPPPEDRPPHDDALSFHTYDFTIMFHRLPLGFTLKQEMDATVVANIYPKSAATHYERLVPGVVVVKIGDTPLEFLGLRQVHELIRHCKLPLPIRFRGWKKPVARRASFSAPSDPHGVTSPKMTAAPRSDGAAAPRRNSVPTRSSGEVDETSSRNGSRPRASTTPATSTENPIPTLFDDASELTAQGPQTPSPYSQTKQRLTSERKKTNASSPYPEHRAVAAGRRSARSTRGSPTLASINDNTHTNQGGSPDGSPSAVTDFKLNQHLSKQMKPGDDGDEQLSPVTPENVVGSINSMIEKFATSAIGEPNEQVPRDQCDADSNQNEEETEEMLLEHINILRSELTKKYEEAKQLASQLEKYNARLKSVHRKRAGKENTNPPEQTPTPVRKSPPKLTLTPQVLEAIDSKAGLPAKSAYAGSNASSVSGYSSYSNRSAVAKRHAHQLSRYVGRTGESSNRCDASVSSYSSATHRRERQGSFNFGDGLKSPRRQAVQNVSSRYNFMPPKYSATDKFYDAPSTFSTKGGLISKAKVTRDSYIKIPDTPGVGAYDVKLPQERVRGGEIGDSDRSLPWP